ncbi:olfactory receptor 10C1-like [Alligator mississippiensis]|uniref:olfactory receptor 10C1-like n=1 Tax=Alligator mississippiensis TaxID=8496 RepID=UPI0003D1004F|nr:olfactory receptor 10C1-like [Alligator mississippiensis]
MTQDNRTAVTGFILLGFSEIHELQPLLFTMLLFLYILTLMANTLIVVVINGDHTFDTPMYFFLTHLSCLDVCYLSVIIPIMLENLLVQKMGISMVGCAIQMFLFLLFGVAECFLLAAMAFDRYVAICYPLHYGVIMSRIVCKKLVVASYVCGTAVGLVHTIIAFSLPFCALVITHFFCEIQPLLELLCGDTSLSEIQVIAVAVFAIMVPFLMIIFSYICILSTILKMPSVEGRHKTFSTCSSHLLVVILFYGTASSTYLRPKSSYSPPIDKLLSLAYSILTPLLNPIIYSLRNKEVKEALMKQWRKFIFP